MSLDYQDWPQRRSAYAMLELEPVRAVLSVFSEEAGQKVIVRYPGGDGGNDWALEFREWLVSLGVPSYFIILEPGSGGADHLLIMVDAMPSAAVYGTRKVYAPNTTRSGQ
jgi:hypothetical protein